MHHLYACTCLVRWHSHMAQRAVVGHFPLSAQVAFEMPKMQKRATSLCWGHFKRTGAHLCWWKGLLGWLAQPQRRAPPAKISALLSFRVPSRHAHKRLDGKRRRGRGEGLDERQQLVLEVLHEGWRHGERGDDSEQPDPSLDAAPDERSPAGVKRVRHRVHTCLRPHAAGRTQATNKTQAENRSQATNTMHKQDAHT